MHRVLNHQSPNHPGFHFQAVHIAKTRSNSVSFPTVPGAQAQWYSHAYPLVSWAEAGEVVCGLLRPLLRGLRLQVVRDRVVGEEGAVGIPVGMKFGEEGVAGSLVEMEVGEEVVVGIPVEVEAGFGVERFDLAAPVVAVAPQVERVCRGISRSVIELCISD